jgi:hypothetical protein
MNTTAITMNERLFVFISGHLHDHEKCKITQKNEARGQVAYVCPSLVYLLKQNEISLVTLM